MSLLERVNKGVRQRPFRMVLYGVEGIGKSEFAAQFPAPIFLAAEDGVDHIDTSSFVPASWMECINFLSELYSTEHGYQSLVVDTVRWMESMVGDFICERERVPSLAKISYGRSGSYVMSEFQKAMQWFSALRNVKGMNIILVGHADVKKFGNPEGDDYDRYSISMSNKYIAEELKQWAEIVGFYNFDHTVDKGEGFEKPKGKSLNRRLLHVERSVAFDAKNRYKLPSPIDLTGSAEKGFASFIGFYNKSPVFQTTPESNQ